MLQGRVVGGKAKGREYSGTIDLRDTTSGELVQMEDTAIGPLSRIIRCWRAAWPGLARFPWRRFQGARSD